MTNRTDWISDHKAEMVEDPVCLMKLLYDTDIDTDKLTMLLAQLFVARTYEHDNLVDAISNLRDFCEESLGFLAEKECDSDPLRFSTIDDYWEER